MIATSSGRSPGFSRRYSTTRLKNPCFSSRLRHAGKNLNEHHVVRAIYFQIAGVIDQISGRVFRDHLKMVSRWYANRFHHRAVDRFADGCDVLLRLPLKQINSNEGHMRTSQRLLTR